MFKIYYDDDTTYTGDPYNAPGLGVLIIVEDDSLHGRRIIQNGDYYCYDDRGEGMAWWESDFVGLIDYLIKPGVKKVLIGRLVSNSLHQKVFDRAYSDPDFAPKTGNSLRHHGKVS